MGCQCHPSWKEVISRSNPVTLNLNCFRGGTRDGRLAQDVGPRLCWSACSSMETWGPGSGHSDKSTGFTGVGASEETEPVVQTDPSVDRTGAMPVLLASEDMSPALPASLLCGSVETGRCPLDRQAYQQP